MKSLTALLLLLVAAPLGAQLDPVAKRDVVTAVAGLLRTRYVFAEVGSKAAERIEKRLQDRAYDSAITPAEFTDALNADLQEIAHDKHLHVGLVSTAPKVSMRSPELRKENYGFPKVEILSGNVGYLKLNLFADPKNAGDTAAGAMRFLANADAIIVDLRDNGGGRAEMVALLANYFFEHPVHLADIYWRDGDRTEAIVTPAEIDGKRMPDVPLFILTSGRTFSAAEAFAYLLQAMKRATVIGEVTGGGANPSEFLTLVHGFTASIPNGRTLSPITKTNWEGVGVQPDVVAPADRALEAAIERAKEALHNHVVSFRAEQGLP